MKATAVTGVAAAVAGSAYEGLTRLESVKAAAASTTKIVKTNCRACIANCGVLAHVKDGRVIKLEGNSEYPMSKGAMCAKGLSGIQALYHPNRNKYPMKRMGARGEGKWKRISWDEALDTISKKLMETREKYGAETVFGSTGGGGNPEFWSVGRFCNAFGTPNWFEPGCAQCYLPRTLAFGLMYGGPDTSIADSCSLEIYTPDTPIKSLVLWATVPSYNTPAGGGHAVAELRARGVKTVVIDPRLTPDAAKADVWLPIRPGTDAALMLAWTRYILEKKLYDADFVMKWTNLPYLVNTETKLLLRANELKSSGDAHTFVVWDKKSNSARPMSYPWDDTLDPSLDGTFAVNGQEYKTGFQLLKERAEPYTLAKAAEICWLDAHKIEEAINIYAKNTPGGVVLGVATDQNPNSVQVAMGAVVLNSIMGNVEKPGALMQRFKGSGITHNTYIVAPAMKLLPGEQLDKRLGLIEYKGLLMWWAAQPSSVLQAILTGKPYKPRVWLDRSGNKLATLGNSSSWLPAIEQMDMIVHMYMYPTSFSAYADILLPATEWLETNMLVESLNKVCARQEVTHLWETMDESLYWSKLAKRCADLGHDNCKKAFDAEFMGPDMPYWDSMEELLNARLAPLHMSWDEFKAKAPFDYCTMEEYRQHYVYKISDPKTGKPIGFGTGSKKIELYAECMIILGRTGAPFSPHPLPPASKDYDPLPYFLEPFESPNREIAKQYPLVLTSGRIPFYHHTTLRNSAFLREICPVAEIWINPANAPTYGIVNGDWVWVESLRGKTQAKARVTEGIAPGVVYMERFWNPETLNTETHGWREMNVNVLTKNDAPFNDVVGTYTLRGFQVKVSKADGPPKGIWQKPEEFKPWLAEPSDPTEQVKV
jgi:anaerobic selenocysteine-containing dehydrogenase